jgi:hypothetical protein
MKEGPRDAGAARWPARTFRITSLNFALASNVEYTRPMRILLFEVVRLV